MQSGYLIVHGALERVECGGQGARMLAQSKEHTGTMFTRGPCPGLAMDWARVGPRLLLASARKTHRIAPLDLRSCH